MRKKERLWCDPEFKKKIEKERIELGFSSVMDYTKFLSSSNDPLKELFINDKNKKKKGGVFDLF